MEVQSRDLKLVRSGRESERTEHFTGTSAQSPLSGIAPGPTRIISSSLPLSWRGVLVERHSSFPGERASASIDSHVISMFTGAPSRFEHRNIHGTFAPCLNRPGMIMTTPCGPVPDIRLHTPAEFVHCALEEGFTRGVLDELDRQPSSTPLFRPGIRDKAIQQILGLLVEELETKRPLGRLYVDALGLALANRYLLLELGCDLRPKEKVCPLPARILCRVREKIESNLDADLTLDSLARESGYSRAHFLRMFRTATGLTPHQYVLELRLNRARQCLQRKDASIIDVAFSCGFSSQSHMTSVFRQRLEMTPGQLKRNV